MKYLENKYTKLYYQIIDRASNRTIDGYTENHHIIPKSLGGSNRKENLVRLTVKEHRICHKLLLKMVEFQSKKQRKYFIVALNGFRNPNRK